MSVLESIFGSGDKAAVTVKVELKDESLIKLLFVGAGLILLAGFVAVISRRLS